MLMCFLSMEGRASFPRWALAIGDASYSLYLFHPYIVQLVSTKIVSFDVLTPLSLATLIATVGACFLFAIASYMLVERPSNDFCAGPSSRQLSLLLPESLATKPCSSDTEYAA